MTELEGRIEALEAAVYGTRQTPGLITAVFGNSKPGLVQRMLRLEWENMILRGLAVLAAGAGISALIGIVAARVSG